MVTEQFALKLAESWIAAWNRHDADAVAEFYTEDVEFTSPFVIKLLNIPSGIIYGTTKLRDYIRTGLEAFPNLELELTDVLTGVHGMSLNHRSVRGLIATEVMFIDAKGLVERGYAFYKY